MFPLHLDVRVSGSLSVQLLLSCTIVNAKLRDYPDLPREFVRIKAPDDELVGATALPHPRRGEAVLLEVPHHRHLVVSR